MTDVDIAREAATYLNKVSIGYKEWLRRCTNPDYPKRETYWWKVDDALRRLGFQIDFPPDPVPVPVPPPPPPPAASLWQYTCHMAQEPLEALKAPAHYKRIGFTADPAYDQWATRAAADQCRAAGREPFVWFVPTQVSLARAQQVADRLGIPYSLISGECEGPDQFDASYNAGLRVMIGWLSSLRDDQKAKIASGEVLLILEHYWNLNPGLVIDYQNLPVVGVAVAVYDGHGEVPGLPAGWNPHIKDYLATPGHFPPGSGVFGPGMTDEDWELLP